MKRTLVTLALVAAAGTADAQTVQMQNGGQAVQTPIGSTMNTGNSATTVPPGAGTPVGTAGAEPAGARDCSRADSSRLDLALATLSVGADPPSSAEPVSVGVAVLVSVGVAVAV